METDVAEAVRGSLAKVRTSYVVVEVPVVLGYFYVPLQQTETAPPLARPPEATEGGKEAGRQLLKLLQGGERPRQRPDQPARTAGKRGTVDQQTGDEPQWTVVANRKRSRWQSALAQQQLSQRIWDMQTEQSQRRLAAVRIQCLVRRHLGVMVMRACRRERDAQKLQLWFRHLQIHHKLKFKEVVTVGPVAPTDAGQVVSARKEVLKSADMPTDDELLSLAIQQANNEEAALMLSLQPVLEGARKALKRMPGKCPDGHDLAMSIVPAGTTCGACGATNESMKVCITCKGGGKCGFVACARRFGCAPDLIVKVLTALDLKHRSHQQLDAG